MTYDRQSGGTKPRHSQADFEARNPTGQKKAVQPRTALGQLRCTRLMDAHYHVCAPVGSTQLLQALNRH